MSGQRGFTLVELLLALAMTALIGASAYSALSGVMRSREAYVGKAAELAQVQRFLTVISRDLRMATPVQNRGADGDYEDAFVVSNDTETVLILNRRAWHNPQLVQRSELQRVFYRFDGESVFRGFWEAFHRVDATPQRERLILDGVRDISFRVLPDQPGLSLDRDWTDEWPVTDGVNPAAVELTLELEPAGEIRRIYEILPQG